MPAPQADQLKQMAKNNFIGKSIILPVAWSMPGDQFPDAFEESERNVAPPPATNLFKAATTYKIHVDTAKKISEKFEKYIDGICDAICDGIKQWMDLAMLTRCLINGPSGVITPGSLLGPPVGPLILSSAPMDSPQEIAYSNAIANTIGTMWLAWHMGLSGTLMFPPNFAVFPGPVVPPTPNIPLSLAALASPGEAGLSGASLKGMMLGLLGNPLAQHAEPLFDSISNAFNTVFQTFKSSTMIMNVMGTGQVPSFKPPIVPVGPVVAGAVIPAPGILK